MSDHVPRSKDEIDRFMNNPDDPYNQSRQNISFFTIENDDWDNYDYSGSAARFVPPSPILPTTNQSTNFDQPTRQVGIVNPSPTTKVGKQDDTYMESSYTNILTIISLLNEYVISHPFVVVRRQAQINDRSKRYHLTPFTVIPYMLRVLSRQSFSTFFKGLPSVLINYVLLIGTESILSNFLQFPVDYDFTLKNLFSLDLLKHLTLKGLSILVVTPFICASSVETVQSGIIGESPYPLEHIKEGFLRVFHCRRDRKLPFYRLVGPSIAYHLCYYVLYSLIRQTVLDYYNRDRHKESKSIQNQQEKEQQQQQQQLRKSQFFDEPYPNRSSLNQNSTVKQYTRSERIMNEIKSSFIAHLLTDMITYPFQNVLYRLYLQGTRTLIDNVDERTAVTPLITNYDSATDCQQSIIKHEGPSGLFKGFGALILQYSVQASIIHLTNYCIDILLNG